VHLKGPSNYLSWDLILNRNHPLSPVINQIPAELVKPLTRSGPGVGPTLETLSPLGKEEEILRNLQDCALWLLSCCLSDLWTVQRLWVILSERSPDFLPRVWRRLEAAGLHDNEVIFLKYEYSNIRGCALKVDDVIDLGQPEEAARTTIFAFDTDWKLTFAESAEPDPEASTVSGVT
jgi:hypothetical protein